MHIIFDLDGTLIDSLPGITNSLNHALESTGLPTHPPSRVRDFVGDGAFTTARRAIPEEGSDSQAREVEAEFKNHYATHWPEGTTLYPGVTELLTGLRGNGHHLAVVSNKPHPFTVEICARLFPPGIFSQVVGLSEQMPKKPAPDSTLRILEAWNTTADQAVFVGDSTVDRETAAAAGVPFVGVGWGYHDPERLGPRVASNVEELKHLVDPG